MEDDDAEGEGVIPLHEYIFDPKTGKAFHYKKEKEGYNAENIRNKKFGKNHMVTFPVATIPEGSLNVKVLPRDLPVAKIHDGEEEEDGDISDFNSSFIDEEVN